MFSASLKCFFVSVICIFAYALFAKGQQSHFIYLQTEGGQPFYVKINTKVVSSSPAGYLILPKLADGDYKLNIGFPKKEFPEENFHILIDKKNEGFLLKNFGEKGWGLFNMQSYSVAMGGNDNIVASSSKNLQDDPFSKMLANVVKDSSILQKNEPFKEEVPPIAKFDSNANKIDSDVIKMDSAFSNDNTNIAFAEKKELSLIVPATRLLRKKNKDGIEMIYVDHNQNIYDTIRIFIPSGKPIRKIESVDTSLVENVKRSITTLQDTASMVVEQSVPPKKTDTTILVSPEKKNMVENNDTIISNKINEIRQPETNSLDSSTIATDKKVITKKDDVKDDMIVLPKVVQSSAANSDCKAFATDEDFLRLRKKMASESSADNMIKIAKKSFHSKCFSTEQIKNLSFLFLSNEGKYKFFDVAYPFASDSDQYNTLQSQLTDSYYNNRFKAMIHK
ncbi:MAG: DUF4476 domain-containing protein [Ginsengibacter sp.]